MVFPFQTISCCRHARKQVVLDLEGLEAVQKLYNINGQRRRVARGMKGHPRPPYINQFSVSGKRLG